jgi:beta-glucanase (GH16 family)
MSTRLGLAAFPLLILMGHSCLSAETDTRQKMIPSLPLPEDRRAWVLMWQDDFTEVKLDATKWTLCERGASDWNRGMSADPRLLKIEHGVLHLVGIVSDQKDNDSVSYVTAGVTSKGKFSFQYGKVEIRARFKSAQGAWPALWMLGCQKGWPANGEIDLMEHLNFDDKIYQTVHSEFTATTDQTHAPKKGGTAKIMRDDWNVYGCEWDANQMVFTVNGRPSHVYPRVPALGEKQWPFDQPFYFIFSMQIGGKWVNGPGPTLPAHYPAGIDIDWVRVYRQKETT